MFAKVPSKRSASRHCLLRFGTCHAATVLSRDFHTSQGTSRPEHATATAKHRKAQTWPDRATKTAKHRIASHQQ